MNNSKRRPSLLFLGTGTSVGVPVIGCDCEVCRSVDPRDNRLRASAMLDLGDCRILIDAGPDFRQQMLRSGICAVDAILLTHEHYDHVGGLDDVRGFNYSMQCPIDIYAPKRVCDAVRRDLYYVFAAEPYPGVPKMSLIDVPDSFEPFEIAGHQVTPIRIYHDSLLIAGYRVGGFAYVTDASLVPDESVELLTGVDTLVINALGHREHHSHLSLSQALQVVERIKPRQTFLTHIGHQMGLHSHVYLPKGVFLAYDGLKVDL